MKRNFNITALFGAALAVIASIAFPEHASEVFWVAMAGAVVAVKSTLVTNADATPVVINPSHKDKARVLNTVGIAAAANGDSIASVYRFNRVRSTDRVISVILDSDALGGTAAGDFGLYRTAKDGGAVVDADFFASALSLVSAVRATDITRESGVITVANCDKRIWELLGLTSDPNVDYDVVLTLTAASSAAGSMAVNVNVSGAP